MIVLCIHSNHINYTETNSQRITSYTLTAHSAPIPYKVLSVLTISKPPFCPVHAPMQICSTIF